MKHDDFESLSRRPQRGVIAEAWSYLRVRKKWWLAPLLITLGLLAVLVLLTSTAAAPFIYTLF